MQSASMGSLFSAITQALFTLAAARSLRFYARLHGRVSSACWLVMLCLPVALSSSARAQTCNDWKNVTGWQGTYTLTSNGSFIQGGIDMYTINESSGATVDMSTQTGGLCDQIRWQGADGQNVGSVNDSTQILNGCQQGQWFTYDTLIGDTGYPSNSELVIDATNGTFSFQPISHDFVLHTVYNCQGSQSGQEEWATAPADNWPLTFPLPQQVGPLEVNNYAFQAKSRYAGYQDINWTISFNLTPVVGTEYSLNVSVQGEGSVSSTDGLINCPGTCSHNYPAGTPVTLNANPTPGNTFVTWSGACSGSGPCTLVMSQSQVVKAIFSPPLQFVAAPPCRVVDTRNPNGQFGGPMLQGGVERSFPIPQGACNIPALAAAYSLNITAVPNGHLGYLTAWPTGENQPLVSTMNSPDGRTKANAAIIPGGDNGAVSFYPSDNTNLIVDIDGYFIPVNGGGDDLFSLTPCRVIDTRNPNGHLGGPFLSGGQQRDFPIDESTCISTNDIFGALLGIGDSMQDLVTSQPGASTILAYSFNVTVVPHNGERLGYLTVWPQGQPQPTVSTLNNPTATTVANAAIVLAGTGAGISVYPSADTDLIVDINGYFAAPASNGLMLYPAAPCRVLDTRNNGGQPFSGEKTVNVGGSPCAPPASAEAYVFNATVAPPGPLGYLTLWPDGQLRPQVSTLNAGDGYVTSNMALVPTTNGSIDAYASALTQLILDITGYFAP
jgi:hypothetical protein